MKPDDTKRTPEAELRSFLDRFDPKARKLVRSVRAAVRKRFPTANELAYDYSSHVVIAYAPTDRGIDSIVSIAARPDGVRLYFNQGPQLADPKRLLLGSGKQTRFVRVDAASQLAHPDLEALIVAAIERDQQAALRGPGRRVDLRYQRNFLRCRCPPPCQFGAGELGDLLHLPGGCVELLEHGFVGAGDRRRIRGSGRDLGGLR